MSSSKSPKLYVKIITYNNNYNEFNFLIAVFLPMSPKIIVLGTKAQDLVISFQLGEYKSLPQFHLRSLWIRNNKFLLQDKTGQITTSCNCQKLTFSKDT